MAPKFPLFTGRNVVIFKTPHGEEIMYWEKTTIWLAIVLRSTLDVYYMYEYCTTWYCLTWIYAARYTSSGNVFDQFILSWVCYYIIMSSLFSLCLILFKHSLPKPAHNNPSQLIQSHSILTHPILPTYPIPPLTSHSAVACMPFGKTFQAHNTLYDQQRIYNANNRKVSCLKHNNLYILLSISVSPSPPSLSLISGCRHSHSSKIPFYQCVCE